MMHTVGMRSFLTSSRHRLPKPTLLGYAFQGADLVIDDDGMRQYGDVHPGDDGSYIAVTRTWNTATIGTDSVGYSRLFVYRNGADWIVGSSLIEVAEEAHRFGWTLTAQPEFLQTFTMRGSMGNQLVTHSTAFKEIALLPAGQYLTIRRGRPHTLTRHAHAQPESADYPTLLAAYLQTVTNRMGTLLQSGIPIAADITGGQDSRIVLAALLHAHQGGTPIGETVRFKSGEHMVDDFAIASELSKRYGLGVNTIRDRAPQWLTPDESVETWRTHNLGVYGPVYLPRSRPSEITLSGAGGESHRLFYKTPSMEDLLEARASEALSVRAQGTVIARVTKELRSLQAGLTHSVDSRILHYRYYRDRFHGGRQSLRSVTVAPLAASRLRDASNVVDAEHREGGQVVADLLLNLHPDLAAQPFDSPKKSLTDIHLSRYTDVKARLGSACPGRVNGGRGVFDETRMGSYQTPIPAFAELFNGSICRAESTGWLPGYLVEESRGVVSGAVDKGKFRHAADAQSAAVVIFAAEVASLTG